MSKQLFFAFLLAVLGVSVAVYQICRFYSPPAARYGQRFEPPPFVLDLDQMPRTEGRLPLLRTDAALARKLDLAEDHLATESWVEAIQVLQGLLDASTDALVPVHRAGREGQETTAFTGVRTEAARLLNTLPVDGREFYQTMHGPRAQALLTQARQAHDVGRVGEVARRYALTSAGTEALGLLGLYHFDRARYALAASSFERLLFRPNPAAVTSEILFYAAFAFRRSGNPARADEAWRRLVAQAPGGLRLGHREYSLVALKEVIDAASDHAASQLPVGAEVVRSLAFGWTNLSAREPESRKTLEDAGRHFESRTQPLIPASAPIATNGRIIFRSHHGIHAVDSRTGREHWVTPSAWSLDSLVAPSLHGIVNQWLNSYVQYSPGVLFENAVAGTLSTDGERVYAVDDLAVPPYPSSMQRGGRGQPLPDYPDYGPALSEAVEHSQLLALDAATGKTLWSVGSRGTAGASAELNDCYFLGPPLAKEGRLYVIAERNSELMVVCLDANGGLIWKQFLTIAPSRMLLDPGRRIQRITPVLQDGILICPTNAGVVLGVDVLTSDIAWAYAYPTAPLTQARTEVWGRRSMMGPAQVVGEWKSPTVIVQQGLIVFTAPDDPWIHCLKLRDGALVWKVERAAEDLYVAGAFGDQILLVGKKGCRTIDLATGRQRWEIETGTPSGRGVAVGAYYLLPMKYATWAGGPAVYAIDARTGAIVERTVLPRHDVPGNLLLCQDALISQTATAIRGYLIGKDRMQ